MENLIVGESTAEKSKENYDSLSQYKEADVERYCFVCLDGEEKTALISCCNQCSCVVHQKCWNLFKRSKRFALIRNRLLGHQVSDDLICPICRTGLARLWPDSLTTIPESAKPVSKQIDEQNRYEDLQDELLAIIARILTDDPRSNSETTFHATLTVSMNIAIFLLVIAIDIILAVNYEWCFSQIWFVTSFITYEAIFIQILIYFIWKRHITMSTVIDSLNVYSSAHTVMLPDSNDGEVKTDAISEETVNIDTKSFTCVDKVHKIICKILRFTGMTTLEQIMKNVNNDIFIKKNNLTLLKFFSQPSPSFWESSTDYSSDIDTDGNANVYVNVGSNYFYV